MDLDDSLLLSRKCAIGSFILSQESSSHFSVFFNIIPRVRHGFSSDLFS